MGIILTPLFSRTSLKRYTDRCSKIVFEEFNATLQRIGYEAVSKIQQRSPSESWIDHTGNLRSSIGYGVYSRGRKIASSAFNFGNGEEGKARGRAMIDSFAAEYSKALSLVVIAGMQYAEYVEACNNRDVLASATLWAQGVIEKRLKAAVKRAEKKIASL